MTHNSKRTRMVPLLVSTAMASSLALFAGGGAQAAAPASSTATVRAAATPAANKTVLSNKYGTAKSRVEGTFGKGGTVAGTFTPTAFKIPDSGAYAGKLVAIGQLKATATRANGHVVGTDTQRIKIPVSTANGSPLPTGAARALGSCDILNLVLGPLDLDLLGLQVHLDKVVLNIVAQSGAGNLLGNLLCAVAGLLDNSGVLTQIQQILSSILGILQL